MLSLLKQPMVRLFLAALALIITLIFNLLPGTPGSLIVRASGFFGGTDATDANAHIFLFLGLTSTWYLAATPFFPARTACRVVMGLAVILGTITELAQRFVPDRGTTLLDLFANWTGVMLFGIGFTFYFWMQRKRKQQRA